MWKVPTMLCEYGYTRSEIEDRFPPGSDIDKKFYEFMNGQTMMLCDDHGIIIYRSDVERFLTGKGLWD